MALTAKKVYAILKRQISDMEAKLNSPVRYRGTVATADLLPLNPDIGDMYNIESKSIYGEAGMNVAWNGVVWDTMGAPIDMSLYLTKEEAEAVIQRLVTEYFEKNPVKPGATTEQAQQIEQNKTDIASLKVETGSLKEDISTKITKFYASSQGETHIADSDNGKIMDMMVYGKSEQKQYSGKNLLNATFKTDTYSGVALTNNGDGTYTIEGTNNSSGELTFPLVPAVDEQKALYNSLIGKNVKFIVESGSTISGSVGRICFVFYNKTENRYSNETYNGGNVTVPTGYDLSIVDIHINVGQTVPKTIIKPMITTDLTATYDDFEPYTGGIPSPNPDYPQEIKSVVNPTVKVCGKNIINGKHATYNAISYEIDKVVIKGNTQVLGEIFAQYTLKKGTYTISCECNYINRIEIVIDEIVKPMVNKASNSCTFTVDKDSSAKFTVVVYGDVTDGVDYIQLEKGSVATPYEPYHEQTVTLPYTLNAIPVESGGNVTIDGQQYIADYVDVERGKLVRCVYEIEVNGEDKSFVQVGGYCNYSVRNLPNAKEKENEGTYSLSSFFSEPVMFNNEFWVLYVRKQNYAQVLNDSAKNKTGHITYALATPTEIDLTPEEIAAFKTLATYYPTTNISINSEQLDGYTVFNYPISMANGWNYVKKQLNDNRDYIYDMDIQAAEAYVNSEYAVALTELEV